MTVTELKHQARTVEWREKILACRNSGLSVKEWCAENNVSFGTYYRWEREIFGSAVALSEKELPPVQNPVFAEVPARVCDFPAARASSSQLIASLRLENAELNIYAGADPAMIKALCTAIKLC